MRNIFPLSIVVASIALAGVCQADAPPSSTKPATESSTATTTVKRGSLSITIDQQASLDAVDPFEIRLRLKSYQGELTIKSIASNGAAVKKGETLLEVESTVMKRALLAEENEVLAAAAGLQKTEIDDKIAEEADALSLRQQQDALKEAEQSVKWFQTVDGPQMLKSVELGVQQAKDQMSDEQDELDQLKKMYKSEELTNATADIVVKRAVRQYELAKVLYAMMKEKATKTTTFSYPLVKQRVEDNLVTAKEQFELFTASQAQGRVLRKTGLAAARAAMEAVVLKNDDLKADAEKLKVIAPFDGVLSYGQINNGVWTAADPRAYRVGEHVQPQSVLMTLYRPGRLRVVVDLPEVKFFAIQPGQKASINPVAFPELKYEGMCDPAARTPGASGTYLLTISTGDVDTRLVPGMKAQIHLDVPLVDNVLLVPATAISNQTLWVKTGDNTESRHVLTGRSDGKSTEILAGIHDGDEVLTQAKP